MRRPAPTAASVNLTKGVTLAGTVLTRLGADDGNLGSICVHTSATTHLVIDLPGSLSPSGFTPLPAPRRLVDSRSTGRTHDGEQQGIGVLREGLRVQQHDHPPGGRRRRGLRPGAVRRPARAEAHRRLAQVRRADRRWARAALRALAAGSVRAVPVAGRVRLAGTVENVVLSVVVVNPASAGYFTVYPCDRPKPTASSMNFSKGVTLANTVITRLGAGKACIYTSATTDVLVDVSGALR